MLILTSLLLISGVCVAVDLTVNGSVGETVELPSVLGSLKVEDFRFLRWKFNGRDIAEKFSGKNEVYYQVQFKGRVQLSTNFSLTVKELRLEDSGEYQRVGLKEDGSQIPTYKIQLQVNVVLQPHIGDWKLYLYTAVPAGVSLLCVIIALLVCCFRRRPNAADTSQEEMTMYAVVNKVERSQSAGLENPVTLYETVGDLNLPEMTVYSTVQKPRPPPSPYIEAL